MGTYDAGAIESRLVLDRSDFSHGLDQAKADADKFSGKDITAKLKADNSGVTKAVTDSQSRVDKYGKTVATAKLGVSNDSANRQIDDTQAKADKLDDAPDFGRKLVYANDKLLMESLLTVVAKGATGDAEIE